VAQATLQIQALISAAIVVGTILAFLWRFSRGTWWLTAFVAAFLVDQLSKAALVASLQHSQPWVLSGWLWLVYEENHLQGFGAESPWLLIFTLLAVPMTARLFWRLGQIGFRMSRASELALGMTVGGLAAIAWDRAALGHVVDFIQFGPEGGYIYNPADFAVLIAGAILAVRTIRLLLSGDLLRVLRAAEMRSRLPHGQTVPPRGRAIL